MKTLLSYLTEAFSEDKEEKLTHLEHAEDHVINDGSKGFKHAFDTLHGVHQKLTGKDSKVSISTKYDGKPSVVFGHHPETGRFFVASKSVFNVNPKINYTVADIEKNHGHAPGLVSKLKAALEHMPKVTPNRGIYQGDFMYHKGDNDVHSQGDSYHFTPNTITYSTKKNSEEGKKIKNSDIGFVVHTAYHGTNMENQKAEYNPDLSHFGKHPSVHMISAKYDHNKVHYTPDAQKKFKEHMQNAIDAHNQIDDYGHLEGHETHLKTYINSTVKEGTKPSIKGYKNHIIGHYLKKAAALKSEAGKANQKAISDRHLKEIGSSEHSFNKTLEVHHHLQAAKNILSNALASHQDFHHTVSGTTVKPEGHVAVINNRPTKIVDRAEFSRLNFLKNKK